MTVLAQMGKQGSCLERDQAVLYKGPFQKVEDDDDHVYHRGERMAVCDKTFHFLKWEPYAGMFVPIEPSRERPIESAPVFDCRRSSRRHPRETEGEDYRATIVCPDACCTPEGSCC